MTTAESVAPRSGEAVETVDRETALGESRLRGDLARTAYQRRLFADVLEDGGYVQATIDRAGSTAMAGFDEIPRRIDGVLVQGRRDRG